MMFPDCRNDNYYNERFLTNTDTQFLKGFDFAIQHVLGTIFDNEEMLADGSDYIEMFLNTPLPESMTETFLYDVLTLDGGREERRLEVATYGDLIRKRMLEHAEMERDELITGMIEGTDEETYQTIRKEKLAEAKEQGVTLYNTRKYMTTGIIDTEEEEE